MGEEKGDRVRNPWLAKMEHMGNIIKVAYP